MILSNKLKSWSELTEQENFDDLARMFNDMTPEEQEVFIDALYVDKEFQADLMALEYDRVMVDTRTWIEDDYYMGQVGRSIYKPWKDDLVELFESGLYEQAVIQGGIGSGKTTFAHLCILRMIYEASCLREPAVSYGLSRGSNIGFCNLATSKETARRVVFEGIVSKMKESPYFNLEFPPIKDVKDEIKFPKGLSIIAGSSTDTSIIGMNIFGGVLDESNFMARRPNKQQIDASQARWGHYTKAGRLYEAVLRRMRSRYLKKGKLPGILIICSSKTTNDSFTEQLVRSEQQKNNKRLFVRDRNIIDVKREQFSDEVFRVLVGCESYRSKILEPDEDLTKYGPDAVIIEVPEDLRPDFEDVDSGLRDMAGVSTLAISSFISKPDMVDKIVVPELKHPFQCVLNGDTTQWDSQLPYRLNWSYLATQNAKGDWVPKRHPHAKRHVHMDPAKSGEVSGDAFGLTIAHIAEWRPVVRGTGAAGYYQEMQPIFEIDMVLRIKAHLGEEVQFWKVRELLYEFSGHGFHLAKITTDSYQSVEMLQSLKMQGYEAELCSVDTSKEPYRYLRTTIYENRLRGYDYPILLDELKKLEDTPLKVDHPDGGSKDVADSLCGCVFTLFESYINDAPALPQKGISMSPGTEVPTYDENFREVQTVDHGGAEPARVDLPPDPAQRPGAGKVYAKKPQTVGPKYTKVKLDGTRVDATKDRDEEIYLDRG